MKRTLLIGAFVALLCSCGNNNTTAKNPVTEEQVIVDVFFDVEEVASDTLAAEPIAEEASDSTTVRYLKALPTNYKEDDCFGLVLGYGGYSMDVSAWPMSDGDWLITWHWCMEEDDSGCITRIDEDGNEVPVVYNDPFEGQPYPVIHRPDLSFSTRNYGGETIKFYAAPDSNEVLCTTNKEINLDVVAANLKTRRLLVRSNPNDWCWAKPGEENEKEPFIDLHGWIDEEWVCGSTMTTCP